MKTKGKGKKLSNRKIESAKEISTCSCAKGKNKACGKGSC